MLELMMITHTIFSVFTHNIVAAVALFVASIMSINMIRKMELKHATTFGAMGSVVHVYLLVVSSVTVFTTGFSLYAICASLS
ncbi:hypothetical protein [Klebsiella pneumoniae]|uniref:hypothetical protein n=1 Tax=Klebsiella pneumoniae TaxID=573 RepID=UPI002962472F|nr:hypothetical protein [Klebsiella pneumoniae]MDW1257561.1 hypothetical protein [Klebsiella pneumoniae]